MRFLDKPFLAVCDCKGIIFFLPTQIIAFKIAKTEFAFAFYILHSTLGPTGVLSKTRQGTPEADHSNYCYLGSHCYCLINSDLLPNLTKLFKLNNLF